MTATRQGFRRGFGTIMGLLVLAGWLVLAGGPATAVESGGPLGIRVAGVTPAALNNRDLALYLDGQEVKGVAGAIQVQDGTDNRVVARFRLARSADSKEVWDQLLGAPTGDRSTRQVDVGVGYPGGRPVPTAAKLQLKLYEPSTALLLALGVIALGGAFLFWAFRGDLIRDPVPFRAPPAAGVEPPLTLRRTYSLARFQFLWWLLLVTLAFISIFVITGDHNTLSAGVLVLIGISGGTALGSVALDNNKIDQQAEQIESQRDQDLAELGTLLTQRAAFDKAVDAQGNPLAGAELERFLRQRAELDRRIHAKEADVFAASRGFFHDILNNRDGHGLHRVQMLVWTGVLGVVFLVETYRTLAMPDFNGTLLTLMGISGGTYLGFKIPERPT